MSPITPLPLYESVVARTGGRCECHRRPGGCGRENHPVTGAWCRETHEPESPLHVVPATPGVPHHIAVTLGAGDLIALCRACHVRRDNTAKKARETALAEQAAEQQGALFDLV
ncbi:hypothetical protein [Streptomyces sp. NPDC101115]|uniref:hypothetical protein n=1 Tax=Streptomyces sp. NPDC101115 TaxID=3366106 RepID=UPI003811BF3B